MKYLVPLTCLLLWMLPGCPASSDDDDTTPVGELCGDGADNDGDGFVDCDDQDCLGQPACAGDDDDSGSGDDDTGNNGKGDDDTGDDDSSSGDDDDTGDDDSSSGDDDSTQSPPPPFLGGSRPAVYYLPTPVDPTQAMPLIVGLHGFTSSAQVFDNYFSLSSNGTTRGAMVITPEGTTDLQGNQFWNATAACCDRFSSGVDDVAYLGGLIEEAQTYFHIDPQRIYIAGHSNGGFMAYRMACDRSDLVAAVMSLAGSTWWDPTDCGSPGPVAVLQAHGTWDAVIYYDGIEPQTGVPGTVMSPPLSCLSSQCAQPFGVCTSDLFCGALWTCFSGCWGTPAQDTCNSACWNGANPYAQGLWMETYVCGLSEGCYNDPSVDIAGYPAADAIVQRWAQRNGCAQTTSQASPLNLVYGPVINETLGTVYDACPSGVQSSLWTLQYASHVPYMNSNWGGAVVNWLLQQQKPAP